MKPVPVEGVDEHDLIRLYFGKFGVKVQDTSEDGHRHSSDDDRRAVCTEPDDEQRGKSRFWETVQHDQIRLQYFGKLPEKPEDDCNKKAEKNDQKEA